MNRKPLLAATIESPDAMNLIRFPVYVSPKIDGVRGLTDDKGVPYTRKGEPFLNPDFNDAMAQSKLKHYDFEIGIGRPNHNKQFFTQTSGWLRSESYGVPIPADHQVTLYVFDRVVPDMSFDERWQKNKQPAEGVYKYKTKGGIIPIVIQWVPQVLVHTVEELQEWEERFYDAGWEGIMIRGALSKPYKNGRATLNSQELMKYKRFKEDEGVIIGFEEQETNTNEKTLDAFGRSKRSSSKAGKVPNGLAGKLIVSTPRFTKPVKIGTGIGLTKELRKHMWENQDQYIGRTITFWHQMGSDYEKARFPSFKGFRDDGI